MILINNTYRWDDEYSAISLEPHFKTNIRELGYPTERNLRRWGRAWKKRGGDIICLPRKERWDTPAAHFIYYNFRQS